MGLISCSSDTKGARRPTPYFRTPAAIIRSLIFTGLIAIHAQGEVHAQQGAERPALPSPQALAILIKTTLIAYNHGNVTGNYTVLRDLASPAFRESNSPTQLGEIFSGLRRRNIDISPILLFQPQLIRQPEIDKDGDLILEGYFDTQPERVEYFLVFRAVRSKWRLFAIRVETRPLQVSEANRIVVLPSAEQAQGGSDPAAMSGKGDALN